MHRNVTARRGLDLAIIGWATIALAAGVAEGATSDPIAATVRVEHAAAAPIRGDGPGARAAAAIDELSRARVSIAFDDGDIEIQLRPDTARSPAFTLLAPGPRGLEQIAAPPARTVRGAVVGGDSSHPVASATEVRGGWTDAGLRLMILAPEGGWTIEPDGAGGHLLRSANDVEFPEGFCLLLDPGVTPGIELDPAAAGDEGGAAGVNCTRIVELAVDSDHEMFLASGGSTAAVVADIESILAGAAALYAAQIDIGLVVTALVIRPAPDPTYVSSDLGQMLEEVKIEWSTTFAGVPRDLVHFLTGKDIDGTTIGGAWLGGACVPGLQFGVAQSWWHSEYAQRVLVTTHEIGHAFNAYHCVGIPSCGIMCGIPGGCNGNITQFGWFSANQIATFVNSNQACFAPPNGATISASDGTACGRVRIEFNPVPGAALYAIYRGDASAMLPLAIIEGSPFDDETAVPGVIYVYAFAPIVADGCEGALSATDEGFASLKSSLPGDLNDDCVIDGADLALLLAAWDTEGPGDIDGSGVVDSGDLGLLIAAWTCC
ncbi:MAG TPA: M12 family metallo-peptidase [Phycisphaerales bacterium]|nr:M12 family metallo-peptidase [Phycisphaerales bacterium]HMP36540.1 M12 family metallo-peptidase [Phycisphaerales bacterium]